MIQVILYDSEGMPHAIPQNRVNDALMRGLSSRSPVRSVPASDVVASTLASTEMVENALQINKPNLLLKEVTTALGVPTATAKLVLSQRPYLSIEDLIARVPDVDWVSLQTRINFKICEA